MKFLQSLNSLIDNVEQLYTICRKRSMCDITTPLLSSYTYSFYIKLPLTATEETNPNPVADTKAVHVILDVPRDLTFRQTASSSVILKRLAILLHRVGPIFEAVNIPCPWTLKEPNDYEERKSMPWESDSRHRPSSPPSHTQGFRKRRTGVSMNDPTIQAAIEERMVERTLAGNITSIFGGADNSRLIKGDIDKYMRNGNIVTSNLSPVDQLHTMKRVRDFFLKFGHLVNFSFNIWNSVLILVDGTKAKNSFSKEFLKKRTLLVIPARFQSSHLISYMHKEVSQARLIMPSIDGMKNEE